MLVLVWLLSFQQHLQTLFVATSFGRFINTARGSLMSGLEKSLANSAFSKGSKRCTGMFNSRATSTHRVLLPSATMT